MPKITDAPIDEEFPEETPRVGLEAGPEGDKEAQWAGVETAITTIKDEFIAGTITFEEALDQIVAGVETLRPEAELGGMGMGGARMNFPEEEEIV